MEQEFFAAVKAGNVDEVRRLVAATPALAGARDANGVSAILLATYHGQRDVAAALVEMGAPVDIFEASALGRADRIAVARWTRTRRACRPTRRTASIRLAWRRSSATSMPSASLIAAGADVHATARNAFKVQPVHAAAASRNLDILRAVLEAGGDPNVPQQQGFVPLHEAASSGNREMAELLVKHGANPRLANDAGKTSIDLANDKGHPDLAEWMIGARPPISPPRENG